ncbi:B3 DNA binding domain - like 10 [Theobroma cacao]|nr:B3 DNA binding domain - like 10 [Theobroma cacao]
MWFDSGWNVFVEYYSICVGYSLVLRYEGNSHSNVHVYNLAICVMYFLVFRYNGNSHFNVHVYNLAASEINYLSNEELSPDEHLKNIEDGDLAEIMGSCPKCSSSYFLMDKDFDECLNRKGIQLNGVELTSTADEGGPYFLNETQQIIKKIKQETEPNIDEHESLGKVDVKEELPAMNSLRNIARRWRDVTTEEKQSALHAAATLKPDNPFCRIILKHLNGVNGTITLQVSEGKKWPVRCIYVDGHLKFCKGWAEFVLDNNLDEGDVCVFELLNTEEIVLKVTIFRVLEDAGSVNQL